MTPAQLDGTKNPAYKTGFYPFDVKEGMHYQGSSTTFSVPLTLPLPLTHTHTHTGRRWGGSMSYSANTTYASYGVDYEVSEKARKDFIRAIPDSHKTFLKSLKWVHEEKVSFPPGKIICTHAGLNPTISSSLQLKALHAKNLFDSSIHPKNDKFLGRFEPFHGRESMLPIPPDLKGKAILVSGHHGFTYVKGDRYVIDVSGGVPCAHTPIQALILPERVVVSSGDDVKTYLAIDTKCPLHSIHEEDRLRPDEEVVPPPLPSHLSRKPSF